MVREVKVGTIDYTSEVSSNSDPYIIGVFAEENCGKTRLPLTGPEVIGCVPLEMKSYVTLDKDSQEFGKRILKPRDPQSLLVPKRKLDAMKNDAERQRFYIEHIAKVKETVWRLLENPDVRLVMIDKFTTFCIWQEYASVGLTPKSIPIDGTPKVVKAEARQAIIDFMNSLSEFGKTVVLNCAMKKDWDFKDSNGDPLRNTYDAGCFYMFASHCNLVVELTSNPLWDPTKEKLPKHNWHYRLNVRRSQRSPQLEGPEGSPLLQDDAITLPNLIAAVDPGADIEAWL